MDRLSRRTFTQSVTLGAAGCAFAPFATITAHAAAPAAGALRPLGRSKLKV